MTTDCKGINKNYYGFDWTASIFEDEYDSDMGSRSTSSTLSWSDETEKDAARELKEHFERFEAALYSETNGEDLTAVEQAECEIWKNHYPHLRIVGKQIIPTTFDIDQTDNAEVEEYPADYEEIFAVHPSNQNSPKSASRKKVNYSDREDSQTEELREAVIDKLCEQVLPSVMKKIERLSAEKLIHSLAQSDSIKIEIKNNLEVNGTAYPEKRDTSPMRNGHHKSEDLRHLSNQNFMLNQYTSGKRFPTINLNNYNSNSSSSNSNNNNLSDLKVSKTRLKRVPTTSARLKKKTVPNEYESETPPDKMHLSPSKSDRHGILPPIEALAITPKLPSKRATSAMLRFCKTQPRVRPFTSRNKTVFLMPIKDSDDSDMRSIQRKFDIINPLIEERTNYASSLPPCSGRKNNRRNKLPQRWRY